MASLNFVEKKVFGTRPSPVVCLFYTTILFIIIMKVDMSTSELLNHHIYLKMSTQVIVNVMSPSSSRSK